MEFLDINGWEFLIIAVVGVLIIGPERLPKMMAEGLRWLRVLRVQATNARREIVAAADFDPAITEDLRRSVSEIGELHPKRIAASFLDDATSTRSAPRPSVPPVPVAPAAPVAGAGAPLDSFDPRPAEAPVARDERPSAAFDPDAT